MSAAPGRKISRSGQAGSENSRPLSIFLECEFVADKIGNAFLLATDRLGQFDNGGDRS